MDSTQVDIPLVHTTKGNLPASDLQYFHKWVDTEVETTFVEEYYYRDELVKRSVHVMLKQPSFASTVEAASFI